MKEELISSGRLIAAVAALSSPVAGLAGVAFFEALSYFSAKKAADFLNDMEVRLIALEATGVVEINQLVKKESFLDVLLTACVVSQRTHRKEKIQRIKNAVLFCAVHQAKPEEIDSFFHLFDQLTEEHFIVLQVLSDHIVEWACLDKLDTNSGGFAGV
jgi:hypothetical protein